MAKKTKNSVNPETLNENSAPFYTYDVDKEGDPIIRVLTDEEKENVSRETVVETVYENQSNTPIESPDKVEIETVIAKEPTIGESVEAAMFSLILDATTPADGGNGIKVSKTSSGNIVQSKEYKFKNPIGKRTSLKTFDPEIIERTEKIALALYGQNVLTFAVCRELAVMSDPATLAKIGFKSIGEYGSALFDLSRVTTTQYCRIGKVFIDDDYKIKSSVMPSGLQKGHLLELLPLVGEDGDLSAIEVMYIHGELTDGMSTSKIRQVVRDRKYAIEEKNPEGATEDELPFDENGEDNSHDEERGEGTYDESSSKPAEKKGYDLQVEVGKILNFLSECNNSFDAIVNNDRDKVLDGELEKFYECTEMLRTIATSLITQ